MATKRTSIKTSKAPKLTGGRVRGYTPNSQFQSANELRQATTMKRLKKKKLK